MIIYRTKRMCITKENTYFGTWYYIRLGNFGKIIKEGSYTNLDVAVEDINYLEQNVEDAETLLEISPIYDLEFIKL